MSSIAPNTPGAAASDRLKMQLGTLASQGLVDDPDAIVEELVDILYDPDAEMLEAGIAVVEHALPPGASKILKRELCRCVWQAMLARVTT